MSLNSENLSLIWLLLVFTFIFILLLIGFVIKKENHKITISIGMSLSLIILNVFILDPLYNLIFLYLLIFNLCYFFFFIFKLRLIERGKEGFFSEPDGQMKNQDDTESDELNEYKIGDNR